jgi:hypothetical protein
MVLPPEREGPCRGCAIDSLRPERIIPSSADWIYDQRYEMTPQMYKVLSFVVEHTDKEAFQIEGRHQGEDTSDDEMLSGVSLRPSQMKLERYSVCRTENDLKGWEPLMHPEGALYFYHPHTVSAVARSSWRILRRSIGSHYYTANLHDHKSLQRGVSLCDRTIPRPPSGRQKGAH